MNEHGMLNGVSTVVDLRPLPTRRKVRLPHAASPSHDSNSLRCYILAQPNLDGNYPPDGIASHYLASHGYRRGGCVRCFVENEQMRAVGTTAVPSEVSLVIQ